MQKLITKNQRGFSIIELIIVLGIFMIIIGVAIDIFITITRQQKRILLGQEITNQASYALEYMSKALRLAAKDPDGSCLGTTGYSYVLTHCNIDSSQTCTGIKFINSSDNNSCQEFWLDSTSNPQNPTLKKMTYGSPAENILSDTFSTQYARFILNGNKALRFTSDQDGVQPKVTILLDIKTQVPGDPQEKFIQTTVSQRNLNTPIP